MPRDLWPPAHAASELEPDPSAERPLGPGWFDSSWELRRGLEVREDLPLDARWSAPSSRPGAVRDAAPSDDFDRFDIEGLALLPFSPAEASRR